MKTAWIYNNSAAMGVDIIEAGGSKKQCSYKDLFPAGSNSYIPYEAYPVYDITSTNGIIRFNLIQQETGLENMILK